MARATKTPQVRDPDLQRRLAEEAALFSAAYRRWTAMKCEGLSYLRVRALEALQCQGPSMMRSLGNYLELSPRNMTALVDSLEEDGLVVRGPHPDDRRAFLVQLTEEGQKVASEAFQQRVAIIGELFSDLSEKQKAAFLECLSLLRQGLRNRGVRT